MIFAIPGHIDQIIAGTKTQTRRIAKPGERLIVDEDNGHSCVVDANGRIKYQIGRDAAVQPGRTQHGVWYNPKTSAIEQPIKSIWDIEYEMMRRDCRVGLTQNGFVPLRIRITSICREDVRNISEQDAIAEGGYTTIEYLQLWASMYDKPMRFVEIPDDDDVDDTFSYINDPQRYMDKNVLLYESSERPADRYDAWAIGFEVVKPA